MMVFRFHVCSAEQSRTAFIEKILFIVQVDVPSNRHIGKHSTRPSIKHVLSKTSYQLVLSGPFDSISSRTPRTPIKLCLTKAEYIGR